MIVVPDPLNGSYTSDGSWFRIGRAMHSTGFCVECPPATLRSRFTSQSVVWVRSSVRWADFP